MSTPHPSTRQRRSLLLREVSRGNGNIQELARRFGVSASTVRRDLAELARGGHVVRTYGGALHGGERTLREKDARYGAEKNAIAAAAADLISDGDVVLLDAGTTTGRLAGALAGRQGLTVVTNGLTVLVALAENPEVDVVVLGGRLRHPNEAILGRAAEEQLRYLHPDKVFLGTDGIVAERGLSCPALEQAHLKHTMLHTAREAFVLADHSKLSHAPFPYFAPLDREYTLITDSAADATALRPFGGAGEVLVAR